MAKRKQANTVKYALYGRRWRATVTWNNQRLRPTFATLEEAEEWGAEQTVRMIRGQEIENPPGKMSYATTGVPTTLGELFEHTKNAHWLVGGPNGGPQKSWAKTEIAATMAVKAIGRHTRLSKLTVAMVENALRVLEEQRNNSPRTTNRRVAALSVMFKEAVRLAAMDKVLPMRKAPESREGRTFRITPAIEEEMLLWAIANGRVDLYDFIVLSLYLGQRENETLRFRLSESLAHPHDGHMDGNDFAVFPLGTARNKSTITRAIPVRAIVAEVVGRHRAQGRTNDRILADLTKDKVTYAFNQMKGDLLSRNLPDIRAQKRDGFPLGKDFVIHILRNEFCSRLGDEGFTLAEIAEYSGHTDLNTCARYVKPHKSANRQRLLRQGKIVPGLPGGAVPSFAPTIPAASSTSANRSSVHAGSDPVPDAIPPEMAVMIVKMMQTAGYDDVLKKFKASIEGTHE